MSDQISINTWLSANSSSSRGSLNKATGIDLISATTTDTRLKIHCELDTNTTPKGIAVSDEDMAAINIVRADFHGERNYTNKTINHSERAVDS